MDKTTFFDEFGIVYHRRVIKTMLGYSMILLLLACAEPFEHDASDLIGARIASISFDDGVMLWSGNGLYHQNQPEIRWYDDIGTEVSRGYEIPRGHEVLKMSVLMDEQELWADVILGDTEIDVQTQSFVYDVDLDGLSIEERNNVDGEKLEKWLEENEQFQKNHVWRVSLKDTVNTNLMTRWFTPLVHGTALQLSAHAVDIYPFDLQFDDGALIGSEPSELSAVLMSVTDTTNQKMPSVRWKWLGVPRENSVLVQDRWFLSDVSIEQGRYYQATIVQSDDIWGIALEDIVELDGFEEDNILNWQDDLICLGQLPLRFDWIVSGRCSLDEIVGAKVVFEP